MRDDQGFAAYVDARGQHLVRVAYLLTGDHQLAQDLVQVVLSRAFLSWGRISQVDDVDGYLLRAVVNAGSPWRRRARLPYQQRAVLVLRYFEDLPDAQIANIVGFAESTVRSPAEVEELRAALRAEADALPAVPLLSEVRTRARRLQRWRLAGQGGLVVVVLAVVSGVGWLTLGDTSRKLPPGVAKPDVRAADLVGHTWRLVSWTRSDGTVARPSTDQPATLVFDSQTAAHSDDAVNTTRWIVRLGTGTALGLGASTTEVAETPAALAANEALTAVLSGQSSWQITGDQLVLRNASGRSVTYTDAPSAGGQPPSPVRQSISALQGPWRGDRARAGTQPGQRHGDGHRLGRQDRPEGGRRQG